jgi:hypothetical protein
MLVGADADMIDPDDFGHSLRHAIGFSSSRPSCARGYAREARQITGGKDMSVFRAAFV